MFKDQAPRPTPGPAGQDGPAAPADAAAQWMQQLPRHTRPLQTALRFPHIVSGLAARWHSPNDCRPYLEQLLLDERGNRRGFPGPVASELAALKDYYDSVVHPTQQTAWDEIASHTKR